MNAFKDHQVKKKTAAVSKGGRCQFCTNALLLKKAKLAELYDAMLDLSIQTPTITAVLADWDIIAGDTTVHNHRHGRLGFATHMARLKEAAGK
jgi:hypothetical protein